jgi:hypothetical protein
MQETGVSALETPFSRTEVPHPNDWKAQSETY